MKYYREKYREFWESESKKKMDYESRLKDFLSYERNRALPYFFNSNNSNLRVLDLGGGDGIVSEFLKTLGYNVTVFDISEIALTRAKMGRLIDTQTLGSVEILPFKSNVFDIIFWGDNIEHLLYPKRALLEICRILKKGGEVIISFPNMAYWRHRLHYVKVGMIPRTEGTICDAWEWEHIRFFNRNVMKKLLNICGFNMTKVIGVSPLKFENKLAKWFDLFANLLIVSASRK